MAIGFVLYSFVTPQQSIAHLVPISACVGRVAFFRRVSVGFLVQSLLQIPSWQRSNVGTILAATQEISVEQGVPGQIRGAASSLDRVAVRLGGMQEQRTCCSPSWYTVRHDL